MHIAAHSFAACSFYCTEFCCTQLFLQTALLRVNSFGHCSAEIYCTQFGAHAFDAHKLDAPCFATLLYYTIAIQLHNYTSATLLHDCHTTATLLHYCHTSATSKRSISIPGVRSIDPPQVRLNRGRVRVISRHVYHRGGYA